MSIDGYYYRQVCLKHFKKRDTIINWYTVVLLYLHFPRWWYVIFPEDSRKKRILLVYVGCTKISRGWMGLGKGGTEVARGCTQVSQRLHIRCQTWFQKSTFRLHKNVWGCTWTEFREVAGMLHEVVPGLHIQCQTWFHKGSLRLHKHAWGCT